MVSTLLWAISDNIIVTFEIELSHIHQLACKPLIFRLSQLNWRRWATYRDHANLVCVHIMGTAETTFSWLSSNYDVRFCPHYYPLLVCLLHDRIWVCHLVMSCRIADIGMQYASAVACIFSTDAQDSAQFISFKQLRWWLVAKVCRLWFVEFNDFATR